MAAPKQTDPQMKIRLTPELKAMIETAADQNNRSQNAEIIARLEGSFNDTSVSPVVVALMEQEYKSIIEQQSQTLDQVKDLAEKFAAAYDDLLEKAKGKG